MFVCKLIQFGFVQVLIMSSYSACAELDLFQIKPFICTDRIASNGIGSQMLNAAQLYVVKCNQFTLYQTYDIS